MSSPPPHPSPGLPHHELSLLVKQFEENRSNWGSSDDYERGLAMIIEKITPSYTFAVLEALETESLSFVSRFEDARGPQQACDLFRELYKASGCPFLAEDQKKMISQSKVTKFTTDLKSSRNRLNFDRSIISFHLRQVIQKAFTGIGIRDISQGVLDNVVEELVADFRSGFSEGDITHATKTLFERLGYQIEESSPDEEERIVQKMQVLSNAMAAPFQGMSAQALFNFIKKCQGKFTQLQPHSMRFYAKFISVCNSSGTGKTKTILQLRDFGVCVVYINMRQVSDKDNFPPRDDAIATLFEAAVRECQERDCFERRSIMFFRALFRNLQSKFERFAQTPGLRAKEVVRQWNKTYTENLKTDNLERTSFFSDVSKDYRKLCEVTENVPVEDCRALLVKDHSALLALPCFIDSQQLLVISLDEVEALTKAQHEYLPSHILGQVIKLFSTPEVKNLSIWVIFSSTNSRIIHFAVPPAHMHASQRIVTHGEQLFPPFNHLQLDVFARPMEKLDIFAVGSYDDVIRSGRPLWESVKDVYKSSETMSEYAGVKLIGMSKKGDPTYLLAALSQRFSLQVLMGSKDAVTYLEDSIASHMCYVVNTYEDRSWQFTRYPSEPVLSNAAAQMLYSDAKTLPNAINALATKIGDRVIDAGEYGELISRLLVLISRDVTAIRAYGIASATLYKSHPANLSFQTFPLRKGKDYFGYLRPVAVLDVLDTLFGPDWTKDKSDNDQRVKIEQDFANAFISASHWVTMTNNVGSRPKDMGADHCLKTLYLHGVALQCVHGQPLIDKVIPIMFLNKEKNHCVGWSTLLIQDKNRQKGDGSALHKIDPNHDTINLATTKPYIAICFDFGIPESKNTTSTTPTRSNNWVRIQATGLDSRVFPVLKVENDFARSLIDLRDIDRHVKVPDDRIEQHILATARFATSGFHFRRGPDIPFEGDKDEDVKMAEESDTPLVETLGASGHGERKRKRVPDHGLEPEDVAMEDSNEVSSQLEG